MKVRVRFFGYTEEIAGVAEREIEVTGSTVADVAEALRKEIPELASRLDGNVKFAVGTDYAAEDTPVKEGDVVSLRPPVGGG